MTEKNKNILPAQAEAALAAQRPDHPDYRAKIVELLRSNLTPKIKQERIWT